MKRTTLVPIPRHFKALIEQEMEKTGAWSFPEVMGHILSNYFGKAPPLVEGNTENPSPEKPAEEVQNEKGNGPFVPYLRT